MNWLSNRKIVVPWDFSKLSMKALKTALEMADSPSHIRVINVTQILTTMEPGVVWGAITDEDRAKKLEEHFRKQVEELNCENVSFHVNFGDAGSKIVEFASQGDADLIVMSSHGHSGLQHLLIGSVAERVIRHANCPVLVLR